MCGRIAALALAMSVMMTAAEVRADDVRSGLRAMSLAEATAHARSHHPRLRAAEARARAAAVARNIASSVWLPVVGATAQLWGGTTNQTTALALNVPGVDLPRIGGTPASYPGSLEVYPSTLVGVGVRQQLTDFGRSTALADAYDGAARVELERGREQTLDVLFAVEEAYYAVHTAKAFERAATEAIERANVQREFVKSGVDAQLKPAAMLARVDADLARFEVARLRAHAGVESAQMLLAAAVGVTDDRLDEAGLPDASAPTPAFGNALAEAEAKSPAVLIALAELEAEERRVRAIAAESRPTLFATASISGRAGGAVATNGERPFGLGLLPYVPNGDVGVVLSLPLFDGTVEARARAQKLRTEARREELTAVRQAQVTLVRRAYLELTTSLAAIAPLERVVAAARVAYDQADARIRQGLGTAVEVSDAATLRVDADTQLALGAFAVARARAALGRAIATGAP